MKKTIAFVAGAAAAALFAGAALAHTSIAESDPADGSTIEALPGEVSVRFGNPDVPAPQPAQVSDASLVVLDACGVAVDNEDSSLDATTSTVTATTTPTAKSGRYEMHWTVTAADGEAQNGFIDFAVTGGEPCDLIERPDAADDVDLGFNPTNVTSKATASGAAVTVTLKDAPTCKAFKAGATQLLTLEMDTSWDEEADYSGAFTCRVKKIRRNGEVRKVAVYGVAVTKAGDEAPSLRFKARKSGRNALTAMVPSSILAEEGALDLHVSSVTDSDECDDDTTCVDRAPDLGWVRPF